MVDEHLENLAVLQVQLNPLLVFDPTPVLLRDELVASQQAWSTRGSLTAIIELMAQMGLVSAHDCNKRPKIVVEMKMLSA